MGQRIRILMQKRPAADGKAHRRAFFPQDCSGEEYITRSICNRKGAGCGSPAAEMGQNHKWKEPGLLEKKKQIVCD